MQRREFLRWTACAGAGVLSGAGGGAGAAARPLRAAVADAGVTRRRGPLDLHAMARAVLDTPRDDVAELALGWVARGASFRNLLGAAYLAGLREVNPSPIGGQVHAIMMVASASETAARLSGRDKLLPALFNLDRVKRSQARDARSSRGDWVMPPAPAAEPRPVAELEADFARAMERWDEAAADRAVVALCDRLSKHDFFELLWPWAARDFRIIGHKIIFATQTFRALGDLGWQNGRDAVRSVVLGVLDQNPFGRFSDEQSKEILGVHEANLARRERFPAAWLSGRSDPDQSFELLARLRDSDAHGAADAVVSSLRDGFAADTVWDAIRLYAFEILMQRPSIAGVHTVTSVNALYRASRFTTRDATRRLMLLQAASWMPLFLPLFEGRNDIPRNDRRIDELGRGAAAAAAAGDPFTAAETDEAAARAVRMVERGAVVPFTQRALEVLAQKAQHDHDYKFGVAAVEETVAAHPRCRPLLAGASLCFLRTERSPDGAVYGNVRPLLDRARGRR